MLMCCVWRCFLMIVTNTMVCNATWIQEKTSRGDEILIEDELWWWDFERRRAVMMRSSSRLKLLKFLSGYLTFATLKANWNGILLFIRFSLELRLVYVKFLHGSCFSDGSCAIQLPSSKCVLHFYHTKDIVLYIFSTFLNTTCHIKSAIRARDASVK